MSSFSFQILRPDDWHVHLRDDARLPKALHHSAAQFEHLVVMPNLAPPVDNIDALLRYRDLIWDHLPPDSGCKPVLTFSLTPDLTIRDIHRAATKDFFHGVKLYPDGVTTNSDTGVTDLREFSEVLQAMMERGVPLMIHGESPGADIDPFDREEHFMQNEFLWLRENFPTLRITLEHLTTRAGVEAVRSAEKYVLGTITTHHLLYDRADLIQGAKLHSHLFCLPVLKTSSDRAALLEAATSGDPRFCAGTDSAPHAQHTKEAPLVSAGCYSAPYAVELYAQAFEMAGVDLATEQGQQLFEGFMSRHGAAHYRREKTTQTMTLTRESWTPDRTYELLDGTYLIGLPCGELRYKATLDPVETSQ